MKLLLDTNAYSAMKCGNEWVAYHVRRSERVLMSAVVVAELLYGFRSGRRYSKNRRELDEFLSHPLVSVLPVTLSTSDRFAMIATNLKGKGKPIPTNDIWIAAHALEFGADLLSFDTDFLHVDGLSLLKPEP